MFKQKETRYVIERVSSGGWNIYGVVDTISEVGSIVIDESEGMDKRTQASWDKFQSGSTDMFTDCERWQVTKCNKAV